jgi:hypothetical protein
VIGKILAVTVVSLLIIGFEWPKISREYKKERAALLVCTVLGWGLWVVLILFPELPGPTLLMETLLHPLVRMMGG